MDDEKKWNLNAPQNDTENNRQNEPPRYEHYCMHQNTESDTVKELPEKKKNKKRGGKKLAETISLAVVFGLVAGVVFQGVNFASEKYLGSDGKDSQIETAQLAGDSSADGSDSNESEGAASNETVASETAAAVSQTGSVAEVADTAMPTVVAITSVSVQEIPNYFRAFGFGYGTQHSLQEILRQIEVIRMKVKELLQMKRSLRKQQLLCHRRVLLQKLQIQQCQR